MTHSSMKPEQQLSQNDDSGIHHEEVMLRNSDADLKAEKEAVVSNNQSTAVTSETQDVAKPYRFIPLTMGKNGRTHTVSKESRRLIEEEVSLDDLLKMTELFYEKAFEDPTLDKFIRSHDDPHGSRFAKWIHQKLSGSDVWDEDRRARNQAPIALAGGYQHVVHDRSSAHVGAWYSPKRPTREVGRHFKLDEARVWMRLHFWAMRESGIMAKSPTFADYYVRFIGHFVRVYEAVAQNFARDSFRWSANPANINTYIQRGRRMTDVLDLALEDAEAQIPESETNDFTWPYNTTEVQPL